MGACGNLDAHGRPDRRGAGAAARGAGVADDLPRARAGGALHGGGEQPSHARLDLAGAAAGRACRDVGPLQGALPATARAGLEMLVGDALGAPLLRLLGGELEGDAPRRARLDRIGDGPGGRPARRALRSPVRPAEREAPARPAERVLGAAEGGPVGRARRGAARGAERVLGREAAGAHGVVAGALVGVGQRLVRFGDLLEALLGVGLLADVGVHRARLGAERLLDVVGRRVFGDAENVVVVLVGGGSHGRQALRSMDARVRRRGRPCLLRTILPGCGPIHETSRRVGTVSGFTLIINFIRTPPTFIRTCADECGNPIP